MTLPINPWDQNPFGGGGGGEGSGVSLAGDLGGSIASPLVIGLQGHPIGVIPPQEGQILTFQDGQWLPVTPEAQASSGDTLTHVTTDYKVTSVTGGAWLVENDIGGSGNAVGLPPAAGCSGVYTFILSGAGDNLLAVITPDGADVIEQQANYTITAPDKAVSLIPDAAGNWKIAGVYDPFLTLLTLIGASSGDVLTWSGTAWEPHAPASGGGGAGTPGVRGSLWYTGTGAPGNILGVLADDQYLDAATGNAYTYGTSWTLTTNLKGPAGARGLTGAQGIQGAAGATGATGPQGPTGATGAQGPPGGTTATLLWEASKVFNPANSPYNAACDGTTDDSAALLSCIADANAVSGTILVPGNIRHSSPLSSNNVDWLGIAKGAGLYYTPSAGTQTAALTTNTNPSATNAVRIEKLNFQGNGGTAPGGNTANADCLNIVGGPIQISNCSFGRYRYGIVQNNSGGHIYIDRCSVGACYAGLAILQNTGDLFIHRSIFANLYANLLVFDGGGQFIIRDSHFGFCPYGIYQACTTTATTGGFLGQVILDRVAFEYVGYSAIYTEGAYEKAIQYDAVVADLKIFGGAFTTGSQSLSGRTFDYPLVFGGITGDCEIRSGSLVWPAGNHGQIYAPHFNQGVLSVRGRAWNSSSLVCPNPQPSRFLVDPVSSLV